MGLSKDIQEIVELMFMNLEREFIQDNQETLTRMEKLYKQNPGGFVEMAQFAQNDFKRMVAIVMGISDEGRAVFNHIISGLYGDFYRNRIEKTEGSSCCADKTRFIEAMTLKAIKTGENYSLYDDYTNVVQIKEDKKRQAYWSPKTVKDTDQAVAMFWDWYNSVEISLEELV